MLDPEGQISAATGGSGLPFLSLLALPKLWAGQRQYTLLEVAPASWANFIALWQAWVADPGRPGSLHGVVIGPPAASSDPTTPPTRESRLLHAALWGLLPGVHRLVFDAGRVMLTVAVGGDPAATLRDLVVGADGVYLNTDAADWANLHTLKAVSRCCRRGTRLAGADLSAEALARLAQCGFAVTQTSTGWCGEFVPDWPRKRPSTPLGSTWSTPSHCLVIGAGLAGAAVAASLARRGWQVSVLDTADAPAAGASGLPAGLVAPHVSPDDNVLSRLSRAGIRLTLQQAAALLVAGQDWAATGVLERCLDHARRPPAAWGAGGPLAPMAADWLAPASTGQLAACGLEAGEGSALWHIRAGWIKPSQLVKAWLASDGVAWRGGCRVSGVQPTGDGWQALGPNGAALEGLGPAAMVVLAAGHASAELSRPHGEQPLPLQPIRGQVTWSHQPEGAWVPGFPVNGHGHLLTSIPLAQSGSDRHKMAWLVGASYARDVPQPDCLPEDDAYNLARLERLLPKVAGPLLENASIHAWSGVRCATPTRLPMVGRVAGHAAGLWVCTGMGSRGLTFAALCAELLAAQLHGEPWPIERRLAAALAPR